MAVPNADTCMGCCFQSCTNGSSVGKGYRYLSLTDVLAAKKAKAFAKTFTKAVTTMIEVLSFNKEIATATAVLPDSSGNLSLTWRIMMISQTMM